MTRAGAPLGALLRRLPYGIGPRFRRWCKACPSIVSQLLTGGRSTPGRSPDAARVRGCEPRARAPHQTKRRIAPRRPPELRGESPPRPPACSATKTPHDGAPQRAGCVEDKGALGGRAEVFLS